MRPIIGITTQPKLVAAAAGDIDSYAIPGTYTTAVLGAGGLPILLAPVPNADVPAIADLVDGLVLSGGGDVEAQRYGADSHDSMRRTDFDRDEFEIELAHIAADRGLPTLAICRGLQVVNVALGGSLIQDIPSEVGSMDHTVIGHAVYDGHQPVRVEPGSLIAKAVGKTELMVNSIHHQAVKDLAPNFRAVAWAPDGVVEGIEHDSDWHLLAVQWHPEYLGHNDDEASHRLFSDLVQAASAAVTV